MLKISKKLNIVHKHLKGEMQDPYPIGHIPDQYKNINYPYQLANNQLVMICECPTVCEPCEQYIL